jgi:uncharacterized protein YjbI with pentapeptide repeats
MLQQGVDDWNAWREREPLITPDLSGAELNGRNLMGANFSGADLRQALLCDADLRRAALCGANLGRANLSKTNLYEANLNEANLLLANLMGANLSEAYLYEANLSEANLSKANLYEAYLREADLSRANLISAKLRDANLSEAGLIRANLARADLDGANLRWANLSGANLSEAYLSGANLSGANLSGANLAYVSLVDVNITNADLTGCRIYGVSAWGLKLSDETRQRNLIITRTRDEPEITVDNIEVAQFIYLLLHNQKIRNVIDTITSKVVLILGRFGKDRKVILDAVRDKLRTRNFLPVIFDFSIPASRDVTETVKVIAGLARFVIADITDATEVRGELLNVVPDFPSLPVQPILLRGQPEFVSLSHLKRFPWLLPSFEYDTEEHLLANLDQSVVGPAEAKVLEIRGLHHP